MDIYTRRIISVQSNGLIQRADSRSWPWKQAQDSKKLKIYVQLVLC